jgi:hypothetical protein
MPAEPVAAHSGPAHTRNMGVLAIRGFRLASLCALALAAMPVSADEIRLKDGKKLYGVIVSYEENMFKVKTDFGYVLVEKDKIASIIPTAPANPEAKSGAKSSADPAKTSPSAQPKTETTASSSADSTPTPTSASAKSAAPNSGKRDNSEKAPSKTSTATAKAESSAAPSTNGVNAAGTKTAGTGSNAAAPADGTRPATAALPAPTKEPELPAIREDVQGNLYTNYTHGFRMFKAPSWQVMGDARNALPNAIVAMGTANESSLLVVGREKTKEPLDTAAVTVEKRLYDVYENYQRRSQRKTTIGGAPAVEFRYQGKADDHDWSGTLVVISHSGDIFTVLGMTYADSDLIQIQENVIAKAINSLSFDLPEAKK